MAKNLQSKRASELLVLGISGQSALFDGPVRSRSRGSEIDVSGDGMKRGPDLGQAF